MALTEADFALFEPAAAAPRVQVKPRREPIHTLRPPKEDSMASKNLKAHKAWMQSLVTFAVTSVVGACLFMVIQSGAEHHQALVAQQRLNDRLKTVQQNNINYKSQLERKFSLEIIHDTALREYHMVPIESGRVRYLNISHGDQRLD